MGFSAAGERAWAIAARTVALAFILGMASGAAEGIVSPKHGGPLPVQFRELKKKSKSAFTLKHAWIERRLRQVRGDTRYKNLVPTEGTVLRDAGRAVGGTLAIPVVLGLYSNTGAPPFTRNEFAQEFFTGPHSPGTLRQYWREVSYNLFDVTGTVFDWVPLSQPEFYYTGGIYQGVDPQHSKTGDMIKEILDALDPTVDFGAFDNDGPDGIPNSGDDDGFVDVLLVIQPTYGAECDNSFHMWSHSWSYSAWPVSGGEPYTTNDARAGGGFIRIDDYIIVPAVSCETGLNEIGVICHELGHAFGFPDLYDSDGNSSGVGDWDLMGTGNWNTPASPAHLSVWSREQLGWVNPVQIDWHARALGLRPVGTSGEAAELPLPTVRFRRQMYAPGNYALLCSYSDAEARTREWPNGEGYGNGWNESVYHEFSVDTSRPITLQYDVAVDVQADYDFGGLLLERGGVIDTLAVYTGSMSRHETIDLGAHLPAGACTFTLRFVFTSDFNVSDEDGGYYSRAGYTFNIDNVHVDGGALSYFADFELDSGGWRNGSAPAEYFIVENRRKTGFDANLHGQGILIWHAENSIAYTELGNSGGPTNTQARGLVLEEADGEYNLIKPSYSGGNFGDSGDPYPGSTGNETFGPTTNPRNQTNGGVLTPIVISGIVYGPSTSSALFKGGIPAPAFGSIVPDTIDKKRDTRAVLDIRGSWMLFGAQAYLSLGRDTVRTQELTWLGEERIIAEFSIEELYAGAWDLSVVSGDGQTSTVQDAVTIMTVYESARIAPGENYLLAQWVLRESEGIRGCLLYRSANGEAFQRITPDTLRGSSGEFSFQDFSVQPGISYSYKIVTYLNGGREEIYVLEGPFSVSMYLSASVNTGSNFLFATWTLKSINGVRGCLLYRSTSGGEFQLVTPDTVRSLSAEFSFYDFSVEPGKSYSYKIVTFLNGGREEVYVLTGPFRIISAYAIARVTAGRDYLLVEWRLESGEGLRGSLLYRSADGAPFELLAPDTLRSLSGEFAFKDSSVEPDVGYSYKIVTYPIGSEEWIYILRGPFSLGKYPFIADQNYPNPFGKSTAVSFFVPVKTRVKIDIYDVSGRRVQGLADEMYGRGTHVLPWVPADKRVSAGIYFCVLRAGSATRVVKMVYFP